MGLLDHSEVKPCPHEGCAGGIKIVQGNVTGQTKELVHLTEEEFRREA